MSKLSIESILIRIKRAPVDSPIAVFRIDDKYSTKLDAVFESTVVSQQRIRANDPALIGVYDKTSNLLEVKNELCKHILIT